MLDPTPDNTARNLAYIVILGGGALLSCVLFGLTHASEALSGAVLGYVVSEMKAVLQHYLGSSQGSKSKDAVIAKLASAEEPAQPTT